MERIERDIGPGRIAVATLLLTLIGLLAPVGTAFSQESRDRISGLPRDAVHVKTWPDGKKVAICFVLNVEVWGHGQPDIINESVRQYAIDWGVPRVGRLFKEQDVPLTIALNALFPEEHPEVWAAFRESVPDAPIVAHGINNSTQLLPLGDGLAAQRAYVRRTLELIEKSTGVRSHGWSSPGVYPNGDTFRATSSEGIGYTLDGLDSDGLSTLRMEHGSLVQIPYPAVTVDRGQYLSRLKEPADLERFWIDYVTELAREAETDPSRDATVVAIGIHPFVVGTPAGAASLRRVLENLKKQKLVWLTDVEAVIVAAGDKL